MSLIISSAWAQDPQFGHFYNNAMLYNPAFAGNVDFGRFALSYRNQWPEVKGNFVSYAASYQHYFDEMNSGFGLQFVSDKAGSGGLTNNSINLMYSYQIPINRRLSVMAGLKGGMHYRFFDLNKLTFADQIARDDAPRSAKSNFDNESINFANFGTGAVLHHREKYWLGLAVDHINSPENSFEENNKNSKLNPRLAIQAGWNFPINKSYGGRSSSKITTAALFKSQQKWSQLDLGLYYTASPYMFGLWYRGLPIKKTVVDAPNVDALMLLAGFNISQFSFAYSYDITISTLSGYTGGAHEISITFDIASSNKKGRRFFRAPCPKF